MTRSSTRYGIDQDDKIAIVLKTPKGMLNTSVIDISENGTAVICDTELKAGAKVTLIVYLDDDVFEIEGGVVYSNEEKKDFRIGIRFKSMTESSQKTLASYLHNK